ncbi:MAG: hypothetical protein RLZZ214_2960 [Verrucomicrobiota bacterium]|jgi:autotransporter-associated beta strand protein
MKLFRNPFLSLNAISRYARATTRTCEHGKAASGIDSASGHFGLLTFVVIGLLGSPSARAVSATWTGGTSSAWGTSGNWTSSPVPGTGDTATFSGAGGGTTLAISSVTIDTISFDTASAAAYTLGTSVGGGTITLEMGGAVTVDPTVIQNQLINANLVLATKQAANYSLTNNSTTSNLTFAGTISTGSSGPSGIKSLNVGGAGNISISGVVSDGSTKVAITKAGPGILSLSGLNTYTGITTINGGVLSVATISDGGVAGNLGQATNVAANLVIASGTLRYTGATASTNRAFTITSGQTATFDITANNLTISGVSAVTTGALTKIGAGRLILSGTNGHTGLTSVSNGTLAYGASNALSSGGLTVNGGILDIGSFTDTVGAVTLSSGSIIGTGGVLTGTSYGLTDSGSVNAILGGSGALTKTGVGTATLSGVNTYTGVTTISAGTLALGASAPSGSAGALGNATSAVVLGDGSTAAGDAPSLLVNGAFTLARAINVGSVTNTTAYNTTIGGINTSGTSTFSGAITLNHTAANYTATLQAATGGTVDFTGAWATNNKAINIGSVGNAGTVKISSPLSTAGGLHLNFGTFLLGASDLIDNSTPVTVAGGILDTGTFTNTVSAFSMSGGSLNGSGTLTAATYALTGGTVNANLGAGSLTANSGSSVLNGTSAATSFDIAGALILGSASRFIGVSSVLTITGAGSLTMGGSEAVGSLAGDGSVNLGASDLTIASAGGTTTFSGAVSGTGGLTKDGVSTQVLSGANNYTGDTVIKTGTLKLDGGAGLTSANIVVGDAGSSGATLEALGGLTIAAGQTVSGIGTIHGPLTFQGNIAPGNSTGMLTHLGNIDLQTGSHLQVEISGADPASHYDQLNVQGGVTLAGMLDITMGYTPPNDSLFFIVINDLSDAISGTFNNAAANGGTYTFGGQQFAISYFGNFETPTPSFTGGNDVVLMAVPEPAAALLGGIGVLFLLRRRRTA